jgi:hypothetical protein
MKSGDEPPVEFVLIRSSTGRWMISGESLPPEMEAYAQEIGKVFEAGISESNNQHDSGSFPGAKI